MSGRDLPIKLPKLAQLLIWGCSALCLGECQVWFFGWDLDNDEADRCWMTNQGISDRVRGKLSAETVEKYRRRLRELGLHESFRRPGSRELAWVATLPPQFIPRNKKHADALQRGFDDYIRERDDWIQRSARPPDQHPSAGETRTTGRVKPALQCGTDPHSNAGEGRAVEGGKGGGTLPSSSLTESQLLPAVKDIEGGDVAHATEETGEPDLAELKRRAIANLRRA